MTDTLNNFEGGTDTTTISAANSGGTSGTAFDSISNPAGTTLAFSATHAAHGSLGMFAAPGSTSSSPYVRWTTTVGTLGQVWCRAYIYITGYPAAQNRLIELRSGASAIAATLRMNTSGTLSAGGASGTAITTTNTVPLNTWVRVEFMAIGSASTGQVEIKLFSSMDSTTVTETQTSAATLNTTGSFNEYRFGLPATNTSGDAGVYMDDIGVSSTAYLGPASSGGGGGTPATVTIDASSPALATSTGTAATCAAFTPPDDVVLVAAAFSSIAVSSETLTITNNGTALTWTQLDFINSVVGKKGATGLYYAVLAGAHGRTGLTVTATVGGTGASGVGLKVYVCNDADTSSGTAPAGGHTDGFNNSASFTTTGFTVARDGSMGFVVAEDNNGGTMSSSDTTDVVSTDAAFGRNGVVGYKSLGSAGSSATFNVATTGTPANNWVSGEIKAALFSTFPGAASLAGSGSVAAGASRTAAGAASLAGSGAVTAGANQTMGAAASLAGSGSVSATGTRPLTAAATLAGSGAVAAAATRTGVGAASIAGTGSLTALSNPPLQAAATLAGTGAVTAAATIPKQAAATLAGAGTVTAAAYRVLAGAATIAGVGAVTADGTIGPAARLTATAALSAAGARIFTPAVSLVATATLASRAVFAYPIPVARPGSNQPSTDIPRTQVSAGPGFTPIRPVAGWGFTPLHPIAAPPYFSGIQVSRDTGRYNAKVALVGSATLTITGKLTAAGAVNLVADSVLSPAAAGAGKALLSATAGLTARGVETAKPALSMSATTSLTSSAVPTSPAAVSMTGGSSLVASGTSAVTYPHNMSAIVTSDNAIHLTWDAVPGATSYKLYEDQSPSGVSGATALTTTSSVRTPSTLRTYHYWVTATVAGVESAPSNKAIAILPYDPATADNGGPAGGGGSTGGGGTATSFTMGFGSCINALDSNALKVCASMSPDYFVQMGDVYYADGSSDATSHWNTQFGAPGYAALLNALSAKGPLNQRHIYTWSDHEGFANNATASAFGPLNTAWRSYPQFSGVPVPANGIYNSFTIGRVLFIKLDERTFKDDNAKTDDSNKTMLGAAQKAWFQSLVQNATNALIVIIGDVPITTPTTAGDDAWSGYNTERLWMQSVLNASNATFIRLSGNMHCLAKTSNTYGYDRAWQAAPLNNATKVSAGGTGLGSSYPTNANEGSTLQMFGFLTFTDNGSQITVQFDGYEATSSTAKTLRLSDTITVTAPGGTTGGGTGTVGTPAQTLKINGVNGGTGGNWNEGIGFHPGDPEGSTHQDISYSTIAGGYSRDPYFRTTTDGTAVQFEVYCDGGTTSSNTHYPRSELRELTAGGSANMSFSGSSGTHKMSGTTRVMHGTSTKDEVVIAQIHDGADDTLQIVVSGTNVFLSIKGTRQSTAALTGLAKQTWFDWDITLTNGVLVVKINGVQKYNANPGYGAGQYFKVGCYAQAAAGYTSGITASDYFTVELKNLVTSHA